MKRMLLVVMPIALLVSQAIAQGIPANPDSAAIRAGNYQLDRSHAKLNWSVSHLGFSTYNGEFTDIAADISLDPAAPAKSRLNVTVKTASVETNDDVLDAHLRNADFFDVAKYPTATFQSTRVEQVAPNRARVTGDLTLHGITKPITLDVRFNGSGLHPVSKAYTAGFSAEGTIRRSDFGMTFLVPAVGDEVALTISGEFNSTQSAQPNT